MQNNRKLLASLLVTAGLTGQVFAGGPGDGDSSSYSSPHNSVSMGFLMPNAPQKNEDTTSNSSYLNQFNKVGKSRKYGKGLLSDNLEVSGVARFLTIYRSMGESYSDMTTSNKNISFTDYPSASLSSGTNGGYPMLELNLKSKLKDNLNFNVGYSLGHNMTGDIDGTARNIGAVQNLNFGAQYKTRYFKTSIWAGEVLWTNLSNLTMGQPEFTDNYFERLPWDWYRTSYTRYQEYFTLSSNIGAQNLGRAPLQGGIGVFEYLPWQTSLKVIYGQTNRSIIAADHGTGFPSYLNAYRLEKFIFERAIRGKAGVNVYAKRAEANANSLTIAPVNNVDNNTLVTTDFDVKVKRINFTGEFGFGQYKTFDNISQEVVEGSGGAAVFKAAFDRRAVLWPFSIQFFSIDKDFANVDGGMLNSNPHIKQGGAKNEFIYNDSYFANISQEAGQLTNNRRGVNLDFEANFGDFKAQLGYSASQEIQKMTDTITIQHRVNSFSRSRFRPWFQGAGPYGRVKNFWFRSFETVTFGGENGEFLDRENFGFNAVELTLKYRKAFGKHYEIVALNHSTANTVQEGFNILGIPGASDNLVQVLYNDLTVAFKFHPKVSLVGNFAVETTQGSDATAVKTKLEGSDTEVYRYIDQIGHMYAIGIDYDVSKKASLHLRTKYMDHKDKNFYLDKFSGFETTFELKIFL